MRTDEHAMATLAKRLRHRHRKPRLDRLTDPLSNDEARAQALERVNAELTKALALDRDPVVIPVGKKILPQKHLAHARTLAAFGIKQSMRLRHRRGDINLNLLGEPELLPTRLDHPSIPVEPP